MGFCMKIVVETKLQIDYNDAMMRNKEDTVMEMNGADSMEVPKWFMSWRADAEMQQHLDDLADQCGEPRRRPSR